MPDNNDKNAGNGDDQSGALRRSGILIALLGAVVIILVAAGLVLQLYADAPPLRLMLGAATLVLILTAAGISRTLWHVALRRQAALSARYAHVIDAALDGFLRFDDRGRIFEVNQALATLTGYSRAHLTGLNLAALDASGEPERLAGMLESLKSGAAGRITTRWRHQDGHEIDVDLSVLRVVALNCHYAHVRDVSETLATNRRLQQLNRYYNFLVRLNEALAGLRDPIDLLNKVCSTAVEHGHFPLAWAGMREPGTDRIRVVTVRGAPPELADDLVLSIDPDQPGGDGPIGRCWRERRIVVVNDMLHDPRIASRHAVAEKFHVRAASGMPVIVAGEVVAVLSFNADAVGYFTADIRALLEETTRQVALAWEAGQAARERDREAGLRQQAELRYQRVFDSSPIAKQLHAWPDLRLLAINQAHERTFGYPLEELSGPDHQWLRVLAPQRHAEFLELWRGDVDRARQLGGVVHSPEISLRARDGAAHIVRGAMAISADVIIITWTDLTTMRAQEATLRASESRFFATFEHAAVGMALLTPEGVFQNVNDQLCAILGYPREELVGRNFQSFDDAAHVGHDAGAMRDLRDGRVAIVNVEQQHRRKDGNAVWIHVTASLARKPDGSPDCFICVFQDVEARKRAETILVESERRFRGMVEKTQSGFYVMQDGLTVYVNQRFCEITGWERAALLGHPPQDFVLAEDHDAIEQGLGALAAGAATANLELRVRRHSGALVTLGVHAALGEWDTRPAVVVIVEDITERAENAARIASYVRRLESSMKATLDVVARMVDLRDPYTAGHQRRVGLIAADIARALGWSEARCHTMELLGLVHDVGKIAIPAEVLSKPSQLSVTEREMIKGHAQAGYEILKSVDYDVPVADIIVQHHERLDGSGYPAGLKGDAIRPEARVLAVADVVEAMASHRPYRPALGLDAALAELEAGRDRLYDGQVIDAFEHLVRDTAYRLPG